MSMPQGTHGKILIRPMTLQDVAAVADLDQRSFSLPWSERAFIHEVADNEYARCWVAEIVQQNQPPILAGMAIVWLIVDEAHIATIAVEPALRNKGIGRALMIALLNDARQQGLASATLEVRRSNQAAQALYRRFGFVEVGLRVRYYKDNNEDALILTLDFAAHPAFEWRSDPDVYLDGAVADPVAEEHYYESE